MTSWITKGGTINQHRAEKQRRFDLRIYTTSSVKCRVSLHLRCLLQSDANRRQVRKQAVPTRATSPLTDLPPKRAEDGRKERDRRRKRKRRTKKRQEVRTNSPHWLPGPFWVVLNGPEQR